MAEMLENKRGHLHQWSKHENENCDFYLCKSTFTNFLENVGFMHKSIILPRNKCEFVIKSYTMSVTIGLIIEFRTILEKRACNY